MEFLPVTLFEEATTALRSAPPREPEVALSSPGYTFGSTAMISAGRSTLRSYLLPRVSAAGFLEDYMPYGR